MALPNQYKYLKSEPGPKILIEGLRLYGTTETPGTANNKEILAWAKETGIGAYKMDATPWCGLFMAVVAQRAGKTFPAQPLWALNWKKFGVEAETAMLGDVLVFVRPGGGHVGFYVGEDAAVYHVFGGNTSDKVAIARIQKSRCVAIRRPAYNVQPDNVRVVHLTASGPVSENEA